MPKHLDWSNTSDIMLTYAHCGFQSGLSLTTKRSRRANRSRKIYFGYSSRSQVSLSYGDTLEVNLHPCKPETFYYPEVVAWQVTSLPRIRRSF